MTKRSTLSALLSNAMDKMGYGAAMVKCRQGMYRELDKISNRNNKDGPCTRFTTGGKAEGTARYFESDIDHMHIVKHVICSNEPEHFDGSSQITLFKVENEETPPGYAKLKLLKQNGNCLKEEIADSLFENSKGEKYISSIKFTENIKESTIWLPGFTVQAKSGPSSPVSNGYLSIDRVVSFNCFLPIDSRNWPSQRSEHTWRGFKKRLDISEIEAHAVPVGNNLSADKYLEWRVSYTKAELFLILSLSQPELKVYILLKLITRTILKPICNEMTSYLMKNVILWVCDRHHSPYFSRNENILDVLQCSINFLRNCLLANVLPNFMLPSRNLLRGRVGQHENKKLIHILSNMLNSGPAMIFYCSKVKIAMHAILKIPKIFEAYSEYRDEIEKMIMVLCACRARLRTPGVSQEQYDKLLLQDRVYRTTKLKILTQIGLLSPSTEVSKDEIEELIKSTKGKYYERLSRMLS